MGNQSATEFSGSRGFASVRRNEALELVEPVQDNVDLGRFLAIGLFDHHETLAVAGNVVVPNRRVVQKIVSLSRTCASCETRSHQPAGSSPITRSQDGGRCPSGNEGPIALSAPIGPPPFPILARASFRENRWDIPT